MAGLTQIHTVLVLVVLVTSLTSAQYDEQPSSQELSGRGIENWGAWGEWDMCPPGTYVRAAQLKVLKPQGGGDDSALNGVRLYCGDPKDRGTKAITSSVGPWGEWLWLTPKLMCPHEIHGLELKYEDYKPWNDDTGATNMRFWCYDKYPDETSNGLYESKRLEQPKMEWAWGSWVTKPAYVCPLSERNQKQAICGIRTQIVWDQGEGGDDTGFNDIRIKCCPVDGPREGK